MNDARDPYAAPSTHHLERSGGSRVYAPPASRFMRLVASIVDLVTIFALFFGLMLVAVLMGFDDIDVNDDMFDLVAVGAFVTIYLALNGPLLARRGQTFGKLVVGVKIVDHETGAVPSVLKTIGIRWFAVNFLGLVPLFSLIDTLFIFREDRRCIHDLMASTSVVKSR